MKNDDVKNETYLTKAPNPSNTPFHFTSSQLTF